MTIPHGLWIQYIDLLAAIDSTAAKKFTAYLNAHEVDSSEGRKTAIDYAHALAQKYGESAAAVACEFYDAVAAASGAIVPAAAPAALPEYGEVAKTVNGMLKQNQGSEATGSAIGRLVKRAGADTTLKNAIRDGAEWAWIPNGDTCGFCITLASRGWQGASRKVLKGNHAEHIHANCDCEFAIRFDSRTRYDGYDPDEYLKIYEEAEGSTPQEKINSIRRDLYEKNREKILKQKREAYERTRERLSLRKYKDPIFDIFGAAIDSHPEEVARITREAAELGVEVRQGEGRMGYAPGIHRGEPGQLFVDEKDSIGAWLHEEQHMIDDMRDGWPGFAGTMDVDRRTRMEYNAYMQEIELAREAGREDIASKLKELYNQEIQSFGGEPIDIK